jgi:uncharacterized protein YbjT (DUF2867 family)
LFLTGGSGFVGRAVIRHAVGTLNWRVKAIARSEKAAKVVEDAGAEAVRGVDLSDVTALQQAAQGCDVAIHCAGQRRNIGFVKNHICGFDLFYFCIFFWLLLLLLLLLVCSGCDNVGQR